MSIREEMKRLKKRRYMVAEVDGLTVAFQSMTERERSRINYLTWGETRDLDDAQIRKLEEERAALASARLIQFAQVDPESKDRIWTDEPEHTDEIADMDSGTINKMVVLINRHCGYTELGKDDIDAMVKNFSATDDAILPMSSPENVAG